MSEHARISMGPLHFEIFCTIGCQLRPCAASLICLSSQSLMCRLQKADVDIIIYTYREFYESFGKAEDYDAISAYQEFFKSSTAELTAESKAKAADQGGASSLETATASQRAMPERGTGTRPQRAMSMQARPAAQQKKALPEEEAATAPQHKPLLTQKSTQLQEKASPSKPSQEDASAEEKQAGNNRTHSKEQASVKWADAMPELKAFEAAREEVIAACEALALAEKAQEAARENVKVSREHEALREAERAKKKQAKKARQRATRAQAAARDQPPQQEVGHNAFLLTPVQNVLPDLLQFWLCLLHDCAQEPYVSDVRSLPPSRPKDKGTLPLALCAYMSRTSF